jgi:ABC-2 type transport system permease protein
MESKKMKKLSLDFDFKTRHAGVSALITIAVLAVLIIANVLVGELSVQADLTPKKLFSLTDETKDLLAGLEADIEILALYEPGQEPESIMESVYGYEKESPRVTVTVVDPDRNPAMVSRFAEGENPVTKGSIVVTSGPRFRVIKAMDLYDVSYNQGQPQVLGQKVEQQITSAIAYVTANSSPKIYEITGHNESTLASLGYSSVLTQANYEVAETSLVREGIPADADLVTLIGPRADFTEAEAAILQDYLEEGGNLFIALDLVSREPLRNIYGVLEKWDIEVRHGLVIETQRNRLIAEFGDNPFVFAPLLSDNELLAPLKESKSDPVFQATMGFRRTAAQQRQLEYFPLLSSSEDSRIRMDLSQEIAGSVETLPTDEEGPIDVVVAVRQRNLDTYEPEGATIVALGSATTLKGLGYLGQIKANADLLMNLVNWTVDDPATVNVQSKSLFRLPLRMGSLTAVIYAAVAIIVIPFLCIGGALFVHFRRRHK